MPGPTILLACAAIATIGLLCACGGSPAGSKVSLSATVNGRTMTPDTLTAHQNDEITLTFTTDKTEEIHLHGYDIKFEAQAGQPITKTFKGDKTGSFEIEIENTSTHLGELDVLPS